MIDFDRRLSRAKYFALGGLPFVLVISGWFLVSALQLVPAYFLPSPGAVVRATIDLFTQYDLLSDLQASFYRVSIGYFLAVLFAVPLGILAGSFQVFEALIEPLSDFVRYTPLPAFIPLLILWAGIGDLNQILVIFFGVFWSLIVLVADAVANVPRRYRETAATLGTTRIKILLFVVVPYSMPGIYDSLRVGIGWAWSSLILAEVVGANTGLGHMIMESQRFLRTSNVIAGIVIVGLIGLALDYLFKLAYGVFFPWSEKRV